MLPYRINIEVRFVALIGNSSGLFQGSKSFDTAFRNKKDMCWIYCAQIYKTKSKKGFYFVELLVTNMNNLIRFHLPWRTSNVMRIPTIIPANTEPVVQPEKQAKISLYLWSHTSAPLLPFKDTIPSLKNVFDYDTFVNFALMSIKWPRHKR